MNHVVLDDDIGATHEMYSPTIIGDDIVLEMGVVRIGTVQVAILGECRSELLKLQRIL